MRTYTSLLKASAGALCALVVGACQGNLTGSTPGGSMPSVGGSGSSIPVPTDALPAGDVRGVAQQCDPAAPASAEFAPLARLTRREYVRTLKDLLGVDFPIANLQPDGIAGLFFANVATAVSETQVDEYRVAAEQLAEAATADPAALAGCAPDTGETCARSFIESFGRRAFRRPLTTEEQQAYLEIYRVGSARDGFRGGVRLVVTGFLQSPWFLYRVEQSPRSAASVAKLNGFEVAARLSYLITASTPDPVLLDAAASGVLDTEAGVSQQVERLLASPAAASALGSFHEQWLKVSNVADLEKDATLFPEWNDELKLAIQAETTHFISHVLGQGDGKFASLLTAPFSVIDPVLAPVYGVSPPAAVGRVDFAPGERSGLLTQAAFLAVKAHERQTSPVRRGIALLQSLACISLPPPPPTVNADEPEITPGATTRERFANHSSNPTCASCHAKIDPAGFVLESYDAIGRYRTTENDAPIDTAVTMVDIAADIDGQYPHAGALLDKLAQSQTAGDCYSTQWFRYALKRDPVGRDACTLQRMLGAFDASQGSIRDLVRAVATADAFRYGVKEAE
ncbi:MAG TPA: DUF1592 domain-containing protein [Polyangiaceae bacterium]|nr:DUF1592 domain-containing protein [Polyangiaceae bacterium]